MNDPYINTVYHFSFKFIMFENFHYLNFEKKMNAIIFHITFLS